MSTSSVRNPSRFLTRLFKAITPGRVAALVTAGLITACGSDLVQPGLATTVTVTTPSGSITASFNSIGDFIQLTFSATDANGNTVDKTPTWSSSNAAVATVTPTGVLTAVGNGTATITAEVDGTTGTVSVTVTQVPAAIVVAPGTNTLTALGATVQLTATVQDARGNTVAGQTVTWTTDDAAVATVSPAGIVAAVTNGTAVVTATAGALTANAAVTVAQVVSSVVVTPSSASLGAVGATTQLAVSAQDANGNTVAGAPIAWATSNAAAATVSATGLVTAVADGGANITATSNGIAGTSAITVSQSVATLAVSPAGPLNMSPQDTQQLTATPADANGNAVASAVVAWSSSNQAVATVTPAGLVTAIAQGNAQISATSGGVTTNVDIAVLGPAQIVITPSANQVLNSIAATVQLAAEAQDANGNPVAGQTIAWSSSDANTATVNASGLVTAVANNPGNPVTITASTAGISATVQVTVNQLAVSVTVSGDGTTLTALGQTLQLTVTALDANGNAVTPFSCASSNAAAISVDAACIVTAVANGVAAITATAGGMTGTANLTVSQVPTVLNISPQVLPLVSIAQTGTMTAQLLDSRGNVVQGVNVTWTSLSPTVVSVVEVTPETTPSTATVTAIANGTATIEATTSAPVLAATAQVPVGQVVDPTMSVATVPDGTAGAITQITIQGNDANGTAIGIGGAVVTLTGTGANPQTGFTAIDNGNGTYTATYTPTVAGTDLIAIMMDPDGAGALPAQAILNSPYTSQVSPGIAAAANSTAPNPFPGGVSGVLNEFIVTLNDAFNNPVGTDAASTAAVVTGVVTSGPNAGAAVAAAATAPANGTWTLSYTPLLAGTDVMTVMLDPDGPGPMSAANIGTDGGLPAGSASPFNSLVVPAIAAAANTSAAVPAGIAGSQTMIVVSLNDANGNPVGTNAASASAVVTGTVTGGPNSGAAVVSNNNGNGSFNLVYTPTSTGTDVIAITLDPDGAGPASADPIGTAGGVPGGPSPFNSIVTASGPSAAFSSASFSPALPAIAGVPVTVTIQARDPQNNLITVGGAAVQATIESGPNIGSNPLDPDGAGPLPSGFFNISAVDQGDGTYTVVYTPTVSGGTDQIGIMLNGSAIGTAGGVPGGPSPFSALVNPAQTTAANTIATVPNGVAGAVTTAVVTLRDAFNNPVGADPASTAAVVTATVSAGPNNGTALAATDNGNGTWTLTYTPLVIGADQITINLDPDGAGAIANGPISGSPFGSTVAPGQVTAANTSAIVPNGTAGTVTTIPVTLFDANNNPVGADVASAAAVVVGNVTGGPNNGTALTATDNGNGTWTLTYTPVASGGTDVIAITLDPDGGGAQAAAPVGTAPGVPGGPSPFNSVVVPGVATPAQTAAVVPGGTSGTLTTIVVTLNDANGNPVGTDPGSAAAVVAGNVTSGANAGALAATNNADGTWNLTYTPLIVGTDPIAITLDVDGGGPAAPTPIGGSPFNSIVAPGAVTAAFSTAVMSTTTVPDITAGGAQVPAGDIVSITVQGRDANGNAVTTGTAAVVVSVGGAQPPLIPVVTNPGTGVYTASYVPTAAGIHVITITLDPDGGGPATPANIGTDPGLPAGSSSPFNATVVPGPPGPAQTTAVVPAGLGGVATNITVTVRDVHSNLVTGVAANLAATVSGGPNTGATFGAAVDNGGGSYTLSYTPLALGTDVIAITVDPDAGGPQAPGAISGSPFNSVVTVGPATAANTTGTVPAGVAGAVTSMTVSLFDGGNNAVGSDPGSANAVVTSTVSGGPNAGATVTPVNNANGTWTLTYTPTVTGTDQISINLDPDGAGPLTATAIGTAPSRPGGPSPFSSLVAPGIAAAATTAAAVPAGTAGQLTSMIVTLRDANNNLVGTDPASVNAVVAGTVSGGPNTGFPVGATDNLNGTWTLTYTPTATGADQISITLDPDGVSGATAILNSPYASNVGPAQATAAQTTAVVPGGTAAQVTTAVVTLRDQFGNAVGNDPASATALVAGTISTGPNAGATVTAVQASPGNNGVWNLTYTPSVSGTDNMSITLDLDAGGPLPPTAIGGSPFATIVAPAIATPAQTTAVVPAGTAGQVTTAVVTLNDANGNPVGNDPASASAVVVGTISSGPNTGATVTNTDNLDGTWNLTYTPTVSGGTDQMTITLDPDGVSGATGIGGSPYSTVVSPGVAAPAATTANVPAGTSGLVTTVLVTLNDANGNPVGTDPASAAAVVAASVSGGPNTGATVTPTDNGNGTWNVTYTPTLVGTDQITITLDPDGVSGATGISGSPFSTIVGPGAPSPATTDAVVPAGTQGALTTIVVTLRDAAGNPLTANGSEVVAGSVSAGPNAGEIVSASANGDGTWDLTYTPLVANGAGTDQITITLDPDGVSGGTAILNSPYSSIIP